MAVFANFVGQAYQADSLLADAQSSMNLFVEGVESGEGQNVAYLRETPGLALAYTLPQSPNRGIFVGENRLFYVNGAILYECFAPATGTVTTVGTAVTWVSGTLFASTFAGAAITINGVAYTALTVNSPTSITLASSAGTQAAPVALQVLYNQIGNVGNDGLPIQMFPNGNQILIISAGRAYTATAENDILAAVYPNRYGTVTIDATGLIVTWASGPLFNIAMVPLPGIEPGIIFIDTVPYTVAGITSSTVLTITSAAPTSTVPVPYYAANETPGTGTGAVAIVPVTAAQGAFLDGVGIVSAPSSKQMNNSAINDFTTWPPLNFASKQSYPDNINSLLTDHEELYVFGTTFETEVWQTNPAATAFSLQRNTGLIMQHASVAPFSPTSLGEGVAWLGGTKDGWTIAYRATGSIPARVSTHAIEKVWASYPTTADAVSMRYIDEGHEFWIITFPSGNATWCYDATAASWSPRGWWNGTSNDRQRQMFHGWVFGGHYVGDWQNGNVYLQSTNYFTDNGTLIQRQRAAPHLNTENLWTYYDEFQLLTDAGAGVVFTLDWSDDGAVTWHTGVTATPNGVAGRLLRTVWRRLGRSRDRVWRVTWTAASKVAIVNAFLDLEQSDF